MSDNEKRNRRSFFRFGLERMREGALETARAVAHASAELSDAISALEDDDEKDLHRAAAWAGTQGAAQHQRRPPALIVVAGGEIGKLYRFGRDPFTIGSSADNLIRLEDVGIAAQHALVALRGDEVIAEVLEPGFAMYINGNRAERAVLTQGDLLQIGRLTLRYGAHVGGDSRYDGGATRDEHANPVTGLPNKRYFDESLEVKFGDAIRSGRPLSVVFFEVDRFNAVVDRVGRAAADGLLEKFGEFLAKKRRRNNFFAHFWGEEFAVVISDIEPQGVRMIAEGLRSAIEQQAFEVQGQDVSLTVSMGGAHVTDETPSVEDLVEAADQNLYTAKERGRNCYHDET